MKLSFKINKSAPVVFDYLTDMQKFASIHPVISKIENVGDNRYIVHETLEIGFIPFSFTYPIYVESDLLLNVIMMQATILKVTQIHLHFIIREDNRGTLVEETINVKSLLPVKPFIHKVFREQHSKLFKRIELI